MAHPNRHAPVVQSPSSQHQPVPFPSLLDDEEEEEAAAAAAVDDEDLLLRALDAAESHIRMSQGQQADAQAQLSHDGAPPAPDAFAAAHMPPPPPPPPPHHRVRPSHTLPASLPPVSVTPSITSSFARAAAAASAGVASARYIPGTRQQAPPASAASFVSHEATAVAPLPSPSQQPQFQPQPYPQQSMPTHPSVLQSPMPAQTQMQMWPSPHAGLPVDPQAQYWQQQQTHPAQPHPHVSAPESIGGASHQPYPPPSSAFPLVSAAPPVGFPPPAPAPPAAAAAAPASQSSHQPASTPPSYTADGRLKRPLVAVDCSSLLELFALYFPGDWPGGNDVLAPHEASNRRAVRESNGKFRIVERLSRFFHTHREHYILESDVLAYSRVVLDYPSFCAHIDDEIRGFEKEMQANPALLLAALQCALHHTCTTPTVHTDGSAPASAPPFRALQFALPTLLVRFRAFRPCMSLKAAMKAARLGQFVCVQGTVVRTTPARPAVQCMQFECTRCGRRKMAEFRDGIYTPPSGCEPPCHNRTLEPDRLTAHCVDRQVIKLQEIIATANAGPTSGGTAGGAQSSLAPSSGALSPDAARLSADASVAALSALEEQGRVPRTLEVHLQGADLVDCCIPGDVVSVCGFVRSRKQEQGLRGRNASVFVLYIDANALTKAQGEESGGTGVAVRSDSLLLKQPSASTSAFDPLAEFSPGELGAIRDFVSSSPNPFKTLVASLCPSIFGHEVVKAGLLLALLGGVTKSGPVGGGQRAGGGGGAAGGKSDQAGGRMSVRGDIHVLCVGDPGLGKSQMLRAASRASPRGVYVSGGATSKTGLTVTMVRDGKDGDFALEAGALVLADQGVCCIDEFDKMGAEHSAMLEAMEQQSISIAKAGMVCSLAARSAVIAAANPVGGHYDRAKTLSENLRIGTPLLSRFDLVFVLLDRPDLDRDQRLSEHVVAAHGSGRKRRRPTAAEPEEEEDKRFPCTPPRGSQASAFDSPSSMAAGRPLARRLRVQPGDPECEWNGRDLNVLPAAALRKYIAYARKYCRPLLSSGARALLGDFFLSLRALAAMAPADSTPVTARQLEALVRLCEARARADLQEVATAAHAQDVIDLLRESRADLAAADGSGGDEALSADMALAAATMGASSSGRGGRAGSKVALKKQFVSLLRRKAEVRTEPVFSASELYQLHESAGLKRVVPDFDAFIDALNTDGFLLRCGTKKYKLVPSLT